MNRILIIGASAGALTLFAACASTETPTQAPTPAASASATAEQPSTMPSTKPSRQEPALPAGSYVDYEDYQGAPQAFAAGDVVLFFNATWCPTCQEAVKNLESADFPDGLTVVSVDYDSNLDLRKEYGVTTQHTFVQINPDGEALAKFTGSTTIAQIQDELA